MGENFSDNSDRHLRDLARSDFHDPPGTRADKAGALNTNKDSLSATLAGLDGKTWWETANRLSKPSDNPADPSFQIVAMGKPQPGQMEIPCLWTKPGNEDPDPIARRENYYCSGNAAVYKMQHKDEFKK